LPLKIVKRLYDNVTLKRNSSQRHIKSRVSTTLSKPRATKKPIIMIGVWYIKAMGVQGLVVKNLLHCGRKNQDASWVEIESFCPCAD